MYREVSEPESATVTVGIGAFDELIATGLREFVNSDPALRLLPDEISPDKLRERVEVPQVAILGITSLRGIGDLYGFTRRWPKTCVLVLAEDPLGIDVGQVLSAGAKACLPLRIRRRALLHSIDQSLRGYAVLPLTQESDAARSTGSFEFLTAREFEICRMMRSGMTNAQIASSLHVSIETVKSHAKQVLGKLGVRSRRQLDAFAAQDIRERENGGGSTLGFARRPGLARARSRRPSWPPRATHVTVSRRSRSFIS